MFFKTCQGGKYPTRHRGEAQGRGLHKAKHAKPVFSNDFVFLETYRVTLSFVEACNHFYCE
jgi:hypothetical protein